MMDLLFIALSILFGWSIAWVIVEIFNYFRGKQSR